MNCSRKASLAQRASRTCIVTSGETSCSPRDGIIKEDKLGLDAIYIQAKRWEGTVGGPTVQGFAGALMGKKARKGILITTSNFSQQAINFAKDLNGLRFPLLVDRVGVLYFKTRNDPAIRQGNAIGLLR